MKISKLQQATGQRTESTEFSRELQGIFRDAVQAVKSQIRARNQMLSLNDSHITAQDQQELKSNFLRNFPSWRNSQLTGSDKQKLLEMFLFDVTVMDTLHQLMFHNYAASTSPSSSRRQSVVGSSPYLAPASVLQ